MIIGLTGGIASGKSTVSEMLIDLGAKVVDADAVAREIVLPGEPALEAIASLFGQALLQEDGSLNRSALGAIVFKDANALRDLEAITHPAIRKRMQERIHRYAEQDPKQLVVGDVPLLFETKQEHLYEGILVVYVPAKLQIERLMKRNGMTQEEAKRRVSLQLDIEEKRKRGNWIIDNSGSLDDTKKQVLQFWESQVRERP
ncbi:dephospho-CoA kinase [Paenibacillus sp. GSMTC-2017]|uniref:dephospho-CoA kinase n=1 Tax=Paenibacillus sp. GSMTC-2017 TaxID=2794350 RepID=UPI0018D6EF0E|nr:dephospho-CoA kinase [Paenibacillus sp. GSMTC-2017]MBH5318482.1 dephospho-CoA kinase [Paenibacillus sp. GSMTC-2017]